ncbi:MAG: hypothetical protein ACXWHZ_03505 [Usitatibacter sp.]
MRITPVKVRDGTIIAWKRSGVKFAPGDTVRLPKLKKNARVAAVYRDIKGGVRLDRTLAGFYSWNVADLVKVRSA